MAATQTRLAASPPRTGRRTRKRALTVVEPTAGIDAHGINPDHATCRALGHAWVHRRKPVTENESRPPMGAYNCVGMLSVCATCQAERIKWIGRSGALIGGNSYRYPDGYQRRGDDKLTHQSWRRVWVVSVFGEDA